MKIVRRLVVLLPLVLACGRRSVWAYDTYVAPEFDLYVTHNNIFRSHFIASGNWLTNDSRFSSAWGQYDIDIGLAPFFRRYVFKDPDQEKSKYLSLRFGYLQVSDLKDDPNGFDEKRPFGEIVLRVPMGRGWLMEDRNRGEYRIFDNDEFSRYRNRLRVEHNMTLNKIRLTPYTSGEVFYTGRDGWNEWQAAVGVDVPWYYEFVWEFECMTQYVGGSHNTTSFGIMLQKFIQPSLGKGQ